MRGRLLLDKIGFLIEVNAAPPLAVVSITNAANVYFTIIPPILGERRGEVQLFLMIMTTLKERLFDETTRKLHTPRLIPVSAVLLYQ
jgi:hypothetical protein